MKRQQKSISAIASLDMNGLKRINDTQGHAEGDRALTEIGRCLGRINDRNTIAYRIGGDEFVVLFLHQDREQVEQALRRVKDDVTGAGYSISEGYAMKAEDESVTDTLLRSDQNMYADKAAYYRQSGRDRRKR